MAAVLKGHNIRDLIPIPGLMMLGVLTSSLRGGPLTGFRTELP